MKKRKSNDGVLVTLTFPTAKIAEAFDNPDALPALTMLHTLFGEHLARLSQERQRSAKSVKKGKRKKKTG